MLKSAGIPERRTRSLGLIQKLVSTRTEMLSLYSTLAGQKPFDGNDEVPEILKEFCESLIDYTANAHFQLYRYFAENRERRGDVLEIVDKIYPKIVDVTQSILDFNDKYDLDSYAKNLTSLEHDLSELGEQLAVRIELEDDLINVLSGSRQLR
jgi:regulator of sigma D